MIRYETDSRKVEKGQIFVAIKGHTVDGHDFIKSAIEHGASKIVSEKNVECSVPIEVVSSTEEYLKEKLVEEYAPLFQNLRFVGVTGTNGKTTTCYLLYQLLRLFNEEVAYIGTIGFYHHNVKKELLNTTPDILSLYKLILEARDAGCKTIVMEVSSIALVYDRICGISFDAGAFTNLTQDHLDFHHTMKEYLEAKLLLTNSMKENAPFYVNGEDEASHSFIEKYPNCYTFGKGGYDYSVLNAEIFASHTDITFSVNNKEYQVTTNLTSEFNVYNYMTMLCLANGLGYDLERILIETKNLYPPKGRCETILVNEGVAVIDYAHTPDAVLKVTKAYQSLPHHKIYTLVGCGGDRDPLKRPIMGSIATENSDYVYFTNDNPRTEDPEKIMKDILSGVTKDNYEVIFDRKEAILKALKNLERDDVLLILGKGHEDYQILGHEKIHFDDGEIVRKYVEA